jgi:hypothetical protein
MPVYFITYDLNKKGQNYEKLYEEIKKLGDWYHFMDSCWFVSTSAFSSTTPTTIRESLTAVMDDNDYLFVDRVTSERDGWLKTDVWKWLSERV